MLPLGSCRAAPEMQALRCYVSLAAPFPRSSRKQCRQRACLSLRQPVRAAAADNEAALLTPSELRQPCTADLEGGPVPLNTYIVGRKDKAPFTGRVLSIRRLGGRDSERDVSELVIDTGGVLFHEGQSFGVLPPGTKVNSKGHEVPQHVRLYSIASSRYGDRHDGKTCTLCVVRVVWHDTESGEIKRGVCSNYISDLSVGDEVTMTGPSGTALLLPEDHMQRPIVCVATGTGIAPFRSFWRRLFYDRLPGRDEGGYKGKFWLLAGFANPDSVLFGDELAAAQAANPGHMQLDVALSLTQKNAGGEAHYVQDLIEEQGEEFLELMASPDALFYFCGLKRMYTSVVEVLERLGREKGVDVPELIKILKKEHRWHVETA